MRLRPNGSQSTTQAVIEAQSQSFDAPVMRNNNKKAIEAKGIVLVNLRRLVKLFRAGLLRGTG